MRAWVLIPGLVAMSIATSASAQTAQTAPPAAYAASVEPIAAPPPPPPGVAPYAQVPPPLLYEQQSKSPWGALVLEYFVPGAGCIYAGNMYGAFKTWVLTFGGAAVAWYGFDRSGKGYDDNATIGMIVGGLAAVVLGRIAGLYDAWTSADEYNVVLGARLGASSF